MPAALTLAAELTERTIWNPTILGVLVVICAVVLFGGSTYLLLATNMGARLGFLVAAAGASGLLVLLCLLWVSTATPLNVPRGAEASWQPVEVVDDVRESSIGDVRTIREDGDPVPANELPGLRPAVDASLVIGAAEEDEDRDPSPFATFSRTRDVIIDDESLTSWEVGGGSRWLFWHEPRYAAVEFCPDRPIDDLPFGEPEPPPACDQARGTQYLVLLRDLGTLRQPPWAYLGVSTVLFLLSLLGLSWYEQDARARRREEAEAAELETTS